jgi:hypothetical protein
LGVKGLTFQVVNIIFREEHLTGTSFTLPIGFLNDGVKYRWNMQAYNSAGWGNVSNRLGVFAHPPEKVYFGDISSERS